MTQKNTEVPIIGNQLCWFGNLVYLLKDLKDPTQKLIQVYNKREKKYGKVNVGDKVAKKALLDWCDYCGIRKDRVNNMWAHRSNLQCLMIILMYLNRFRPMYGREKP